MINDVLNLLKTWYIDPTHGISAKLALVPRLPSDSATVGVEVHSEIDLDSQGRDLALSRIPTPAVVGGVGNVVVGLMLARPAFNLDRNLLPPVRDDEVPILHVFGRRVADGARGTRDLYYVTMATLFSHRELAHPDYEANRKTTAIGLKDVASLITIPAYQAMEDVELLFGIVATWRVRTFKPTGV